MPKVEWCQQPGSEVLNQEVGTVTGNRVRSTTARQRGTGTIDRVRVQAGIGTKPDSEVQKHRSGVESEYKLRSQQASRNSRSGASRVVHR